MADEQDILNERFVGGPMSYMKNAFLDRLNCDHCGGDGQICGTCQASLRMCVCETMPDIWECPHCALPENFCGTCGDQIVGPGEKHNSGCAECRAHHRGEVDYIERIK